MFDFLKKNLTDIFHHNEDIRTIALFGRSAKNNNYCAAGIGLKSGKYVRPISDIPGLKEAVRKVDYTDFDGKEFEDFDVVRIKFKDKLPANPYQPENLVYDESFHWQKIGTWTLEKMMGLHPLDERENIFYNPDRSVDPNYILKQPVRESLLFTHIQNVFIRVEIYDGYPKFYAHFNYKGRRYYRFSVGDINTRKFFRNHAAGEYHYKDNAVAILSLTNPYSFGGNPSKCYKMLAQIF
ncbi:MAG: hypothetical protein IJQ85_01155 [Selenomonadaceae bacterium]|nr:hypothetical protein [Selenomonadaceae bacterium]